MNIVILQHVPFENPGILEKLNTKVIRLYENTHVCIRNFFLIMYTLEMGEKTSNNIF